MARYIDVDKVVDGLLNSPYHNYIRVYLQAVPTADVRENVHGEWIDEQLIPNDITGHMHGECSVCHKVRIIDNFCPNCGADMRERSTDA